VHVQYQRPTSVNSHINKQQSGDFTCSVDAEGNSPGLSSARSVAGNRPLIGGCRADRCASATPRRPASPWCCTGSVLTVHPATPGKQWPRSRQERRLASSPSTAPSVLGGTATTANVSLIHMDGGAGDDTLKFDETNGVMPQGRISSAATDATNHRRLRAPITLSGAPATTGPGRGPGNRQQVSLGAGRRRVHSQHRRRQTDHLDGGAGTDSLIVNGSLRFPNFTEFVQVSANGPRTTVKETTRTRPRAP